MYSDLYFQEKKSIQIPKIFWIGLVSFAAFISSQAFFWYSSVPTKASGVNVKRFQIANTTPDSFSVFLELEEPTSIYSVYGTSEKEMKNAIYSFSDTPKNINPRKYHIFNYSNLRSNETYYFQFITDRKLIEYSEKSVFSHLTKASSGYEITSSKNPIYGKITSPSGDGLSDAVILISRKDNNIVDKTENVFLTRTKDSGEWLYTLPSSFIANDIVFVEFFSEKYSPTKVQALISRSSPIPQTLIIGTDYVFSETENVLGVQTGQTQIKNNTEYVISILYPEKNAIIPDTKPLFKGYGIPRTSVNIEVNSKPIYKAQTIVNSDTVWMIEPRTPFAPGTYSLTVKIQDTTGAVRNLTRSFVIAKSGEQVLGESTISTPSGTLIPTARATVTGVTISPGVSLSPKVSQYLTPTQAPIVTIITATPIITLAQGLTGTPGMLKQAGFEFPTWMPIFGVFLVLTGYIFVKQSSDASY